MYRIRGARPDDLGSLMELAKILNSVNLPHSRSALEEVVETSRRSFSGDCTEPFEREYLFVL